MGLELVNFKDELYNVIRIVKDHQDIDTQKIKHHYHCDLILKKENYYYFCSHIKDAEIVEENNNQLKLNFENEDKTNS